MKTKMQRAIETRNGLERCLELGDINESPEELVEAVMEIIEEAINPNDYATALVMITHWIAENG